MTIDEESIKAVATNGKPTGSWWSDKLLAVLSELGVDPYLEEGMVCLRKRRTVHFAISPGVLSGRIQDENKRPFRTRISMATVAEEKWEQIFKLLAEKALFAASLFAGDLPREMAAVFEEVGEKLYPDTPEDLELSTDAAEGQIIWAHVAALYFLVSDHAARDPFHILAFRGCPKETALVELHRHRNSLKGTPQEKMSGSYYNVSYEPVIPLIECGDNYWSAKEQLKELSYKIKADELPASILRRVDPLPFGEYQYQAELALEEAYARIARRAQAFGLGL